MTLPYQYLLIYQAGEKRSIDLNAANYSRNKKHYNLNFFVRAKHMVPLISLAWGSVKENQILINISDVDYIQYGFILLRLLLKYETSVLIYG